MLKTPETTDYIDPNTINNLRELFQARVTRSANKIAYQYYSETEKKWNQISWQNCEQRIQTWANALKNQQYEKGDRVGILVSNSLEWIIFDQAAFACDLTVVPLYTEDRAENIAYILQDAGVKCLLIEGDSHWQRLSKVKDKLDGVECIINLERIKQNTHNQRIIYVNDWLEPENDNLVQSSITRHELASIVYTSGTTGKPKGVMLTHDNILQNVWAGVHSIYVYPEDHFLSFLPLSHMLERTIGYYFPMLCGSTVSFSRSISELAQDLQTQNPSIIISVPRIFERVYLKVEQTIEQKGKLLKTLFDYAIKTAWQHFLYSQNKRDWSPSFILLPIFEHLFYKKIRQKFGNNFRFAISGGAALEFHVAQLFISIGITIAQGYGLTEYSPVISVNRLEDNDPHSVGEPLPGVEIRIGENDELLIKGKSTMQGYWHHDDETNKVIDKDKWLHTGDQAKIINNKIYITGRLKDIIVLSNGEKIPPNEIEQAILQDPLFENVIVIGEKRPYLSALVILNSELQNDSDYMTEELLEHIQAKMKDFPGYARIHKIAVCTDPWTIDNGLLTPTMKPKRKSIIECNKKLIDELYSGH